MTAWNLSLYVSSRALRSQKDSGRSMEQIHTEYSVLRDEST